MAVYSEFLYLMQAGTWWIMWPLFAIGMVIWYTGFERLIALARIARSRRLFLARVNNPTTITSAAIATASYAALLNKLSGADGGTRESRSRIYRQFMISIFPELEKGFSTMTAWIYVSPLMGLLGTVIGMIETFKSIMLFGTNNPGVMAEGISVALLTTQAGLIVAFPGLVLQVLLVNRKNALSSLMRQDGERLIG